MKTDDADIEQQITDWFEANYETMKSESGHALSPDVKEAAKEQVLFYWKKLRHIAESITETEVHLSLPQQKTPANRTFNIEGVVDIIRKDDSTEMYDIKTHDAATVCKNRAFYEEQLNVYAHIWQNLQGEHLDLAAIIATKLPSNLQEAIHNNDTQAEERAFSEWDPIVRLSFDPDNLAATINEFGKVVDHIEDGDFFPPPVSVLKERGDFPDIFAVRICRNCDARHSCSSYRTYAKAPSRRDSPKLSEFYNDYNEDESYGWLDANLETSEES